MPKNTFWPATLTVMGFVFLAERLQLLPPTFSFLWPIILIVVGLGGLITADRKDWLWTPKKSGKKSKKKSKKQ